MDKHIPQLWMNRLLDYGRTNFSIMDKQAPQLWMNRPRRYEFIAQFTRSTMDELLNSRAQLWKIC